MTASDERGEEKGREGKSGREEKGREGGEEKSREGRRNAKREAREEPRKCWASFSPPFRLGLLDFSSSPGLSFSFFFSPP